jgi:hypothetical protein
MFSLLFENHTVLEPDSLSKKPINQRRISQYINPAPVHLIHSALMSQVPAFIALVVPPFHANRDNPILN